MKTIRLPANSKFIRFDSDVGRLLAIAEYPEDSMLTERMNHDWLIGASLLEAVRQGRLCVRDYRTSFPLKPDAPSVDVLPSIVAINDFREFVAELGYAVQVGDEVEKSASQTAPAAPAAPFEQVQAAPAWKVSEPQRERGYSTPLYGLLAVAHRECKPRPTARDVVETWRLNMPPEIEKVLPDGIDYYDRKGNTKSADLEAIRRAIGRMTSITKRPISAR